MSSRLFAPGDLGGIAGANAKCQDMAVQAGLDLAAVPVGGMSARALRFDHRSVGATASP